MKPQEIIVVYRKFKDGDIIALFPTIHEINYLIESYMFNGEHSSACYHSVIYNTTPATPEEYADLHKHLQFRYEGCTLVIRNKHKLNYRRTQ